MAKPIDPLTRGSRCQHGAVLAPRVNRQPKQKQQQASEDTEKRCNCGAVKLIYVESALRAGAVVRDRTKCRACQPKQQQG